jgi:hypothetical protein
MPRNTGISQYLAAGGWPAPPYATAQHLPARMRSLLALSAALACWAGAAGGDDWSEAGQPGGDGA